MAKHRSAVSRFTDEIAEAGEDPPVWWALLFYGFVVSVVLNLVLTAAVLALVLRS
jgi:hypothetical protein